MNDLDSLRLELDAERHCHRIDNEHLLARAERAEKRVRDAVRLFGVPDAGRYWNDWVETKRVWDQRMDRADSVSERKENE